MTKHLKNNIKLKNPKIIFDCVIGNIYLCSLNTILNPPPLKSQESCSNYMQIEACVCKLPVVRKLEMAD